MSQVAVQVEGGSANAQIAVAGARSVEVRLARKNLKARIAAGDVTAVAVLQAPPVEARTMRLETLLSAQHRWSHERVWKTCVKARVSPYATLGGMCTTERRRVLLELGWTPPQRKGPDPAVSRERRKGLVKDAVALLAARYAEPWTLPAFAAELGWSVSTTCQAFAESGMTFASVLSRTRIAAAAVLLRRDGWVGQAELAARVGLSTTALVAGFRRDYGTTPAAYCSKNGRAFTPPPLYVQHRQPGGRLA